MRLMLLIPLLFFLIACDTRPTQVSESFNGTNTTEATEINITTSTNQTEDIQVITNVSIFLPPQKNNLSIYINDIDGQSIIVLKKSSVLIDAGLDTDGQTIIRNLRNLGVETLAFAIITNKEEKSIGGMPYIVMRTSPANVYENGVPFNSSSYSMYKDLNPNGTQISMDKLLSLDDVFIRLIVPYDDGRGFLETLKGNSIPVKITYKNNNFLFMSNCNFECLERIKDESLKANVLIIDGSCDSSPLTFLQKVNPEVVIVTGELCTLPEDTFKFLNIPVYTTKEHGDIRLNSDGNNFNLKYLKTRI